MILSCPNCYTRYMMSAAAIGAEGRDVRCAKCAHEWFQEPDESLEEFQDEVLPEDNADYDDAPLEEDIDVEERLKDIASELMRDDDAQELERDQENQEEESEGEEESQDIPQGIKPDIPFEETPNEKPTFIKERPQPVPIMAKMAGFGASLFIFLLILISGLIFKNDIIKAWPSSIAIYELAGVGVSFKGEELIMETLSAEALPQEGGTEVLVVKGRVINLTENTIDVPKMIALLRNEEGAVETKWLIDAPVDQVEAGASFTFTSEYEGVPSGIGAINLSFAPEIEGT